MSGDKSTDSFWFTRILFSLSIPLMFSQAFHRGHWPPLETVLLIIFFTINRIKFLFDDKKIEDLGVQPDYIEGPFMSIAALASLFAAVKVGDLRWFCFSLIVLLAIDSLGLQLSKKPSQSEKSMARCWIVFNVLEIVLLVFVVYLCSNQMMHIYTIRSICITLVMLLLADAVVTTYNHENKRKGESRMQVHTQTVAFRSSAFSPLLILNAVICPLCFLLALLASIWGARDWTRWVLVIGFFLSPIVLLFLTLRIYCCLVKKDAGLVQSERKEEAGNDTQKTKPERTSSGASKS